MNYDRVISLGGACAPAWQIRAFTGQTEALPFDWLVLPFRSLAMAIEHDFHGLTDLGTFERTHVGVMNRRFPLLLLHDFPNWRYDATGWQADIDTVRSKYHFLIERWRRVLSQPGRILFIRYQGHFDEVDFNCIGSLQPMEADRFCSSLERSFPELDFSVLFVDAVDGPPQHPRARTGNVGFDATLDWDDPAERWKGPTARWRSLLEHELGVARPVDVEPERLTENASAS